MNRKCDKVRTRPEACLRHPVRNAKAAVLILCVLLASVHPLSAELSGARFLFWHPSARAIAMGGTGVAGSARGFESYYNPALLTDVDRLAAGASFGQPYPVFKHTVHSYAECAYRTKFGVLALSADLFWREKQLRTDEVGNNLGVSGLSFNIFKLSNIVKPSYRHFSLSYATRIKDNLSIGLNAGLLFETLASYGTIMEIGKPSSRSGLFGLGARITQLFPRATIYSDGSLRETERGLQLAAVLQNLGGDLIFIDAAQADPPPTYMKIGVSYLPVGLKTLNLLLAADLENQFDQDGFEYLHCGAELRLFRLIDLRAGYFDQLQYPESSYFAFGAGMTWMGIYLDVARYEQSFMPAWHFSLGVKL